MNKSQKGFGAVEMLIVIVFVGLLGAAGWFVYDRQNKDTSQTNTQTSQQQEEKQEETKSNIPEGWVKYQDTAKGVSFYHPRDWDKNEFNIHKVSVSETVKGTNFGPYSAEYVFKKTENKWYTVDESENLNPPYSHLHTVTNVSVGSYPAVYGGVGEGGGASYYVVFTDGSSSFMIEFPVISEEDDPNGLDEQKQAAPDLLATVKIGS